MTQTSNDPIDVSRPRRRWLRRGALLAAAVGLPGMVGGEFFLRWRYGLGDVPLVISDPTIEYRFAPNGHYRRLGNRIDVNAYSMRSDDFPPTKASPDERRVIVLGDSIINGGAATDQSLTVTSLLQSRLKTDLNTPSVIVGNVSAGSWGPQNLLAYVERFGLFDADVVAIVVSSHDATDEIGPLTTDVHPLSPQYALALGEVWDRFVKQPRTEADRPPGPPGRSEPCLAAFDALLARAQRDTGRLPIVLFHFESDELASDAEPAGHALLREVCARHGITPVPLRDTFRSARAAGQELYRDYIHPNVVGQRLIADVLTPLVEASLAQPASTSASRPATEPTEATR